MAAYTTIDNPELYFQVKTYAGNGTAIGSGGQAITLDGDENMQPDLVWIKDRTDGDRPRWFDSSRGATIEFDTSDTTAETTLSEGLTAFGSNGFTVGNHEGVNSSGDNFVAWCWKESATAGFDIITWSGNETQKTISHNLSAVPHWIIVKVRGTAKQWTCYHKDMTADPDNAGIFLQSTAVPTTGTAGYFGNTAPTSSVFTVGTSTNVNQNSDNVMGYCWTGKQGFSKFGSYEGNGGNHFIYTGFSPAWVMIKKIDDTHDWHIFDNKRDAYNERDSWLEANTSNAEATSSNYVVDFLSNGFKTGSGSGLNGSGETFIYMCFADAPFVNSNGVPCNAR